jgi:hypothetical protein
MQAFVRKETKRFMTASSVITIINAEDEGRTIDTWRCAAG